MQHFLDISQIKARATAINLTLKRLARMAGVDPATAYRAEKGVTDPRASTLRKLTECVERQEAKVAENLKSLSRNAGGRQPELFK